MHPALPLLALSVAAAALLGRRHGLGVALGALGVAAALVLAPALWLAPDGIPGPVRLLGQLAPWQGSVPASGNPHARDVVFQIDPWLLHLRTELRAGRLPAWNPYQSAGTPFWANGQSAPLFPLHLLVAALPLELGLVWLPWWRMLVAGLGVVLLARALGIGAQGRLLAALAFALGGRLGAFLLYPMGSSIALLPWTLLGVVLIVRGSPRGLPLLAVATGLQLLGGHPETALHGAAAGVVLLLALGGARRLALAILGWGLGALLALAQLLPLLQLLPHTARWHAAGSSTANGLAELAPVWLRVVLPGALGDPARGTWFGPFNEVATAGFLGLATATLAAIALAAVRREPSIRALAWMSLATFAIGYSLPGIHRLHDALPIVGRGLAHSSLPAFHLGLALLAGCGLDRWLAGARRAARWAAPALAALLLVAATQLGAEWTVRGMAAGQWARIAATLAVALALAVLPRGRPRLAAAAGLAVIAISALDLAAVTARSLGVGRVSELAPRTPAVAALESATGESFRAAGLGEALRPNAATILRLRDVRGDDTLELSTFDALSESFAPPHPTFFTPIEQWDDEALDALSVAAVIGPPGAVAPAGDWRLLADGSDARVWHRPGALPLVRFEGGASGSLAVLASEPGRWSLSWDAATAGRVVVAEMAAPGWGRSDGGALAPHRFGLLAVAIEPGPGEIELRFHPPGLTLGALGSLLAAAAVVLLAARARGRGTIS